MGAFEYMQTECLIQLPVHPPSNFLMVDSLQITMARTEKNEPVGLEIELSISEALVPGLSEPGKKFQHRLLWDKGLALAIRFGVDHNVVELMCSPPDH